MRISDWSSDVCSSDLDVLALGRQKQIRRAYADAAAALAATGKDEDLALAEDIVGFVADMPAAVSRRLERAREILIADRAEGAAGSRSRGTHGDIAAGQTTRPIERKPRDRQSAVSGKGGAVRVNTGGSRHHKK